MAGLLPVTVLPAASTAAPVATPALLCPAGVTLLLAGSEPRPLLGVLLGAPTVRPAGPRRSAPVPALLPVSVPVVPAAPGSAVSGVLVPLRAAPAAALPCWFLLVLIRRLAAPVRHPRPVARLLSVGSHVRRE